MVRILKRDLFVGAPSPVEGNRGGRGFEVYEMQRKFPARHLGTKPALIDKRGSVPILSFLDLQPLPLALAQSAHGRLDRKVSDRYVSNLYTALCDQFISPLIVKIPYVKKGLRIEVSSRPF